MTLDLTSVLIFLGIVLTHWVADFIFQAEEWATNKSKSFSALIRHTLTYSLITSIMWAMLFPISVSFPTSFEVCPGSLNPVDVFLITLATHTTVDYFTSKVTSRKFANHEYGSPIPNFGAFTVIGFDQVLHYVQLTLTYYFLMN
jgi:hypothetical protein